MFLERSGYRRRRLADAIRLLPVLGALLWAVPLLWTRGATPGSSALLYIFGVWMLLVLLAAVLSQLLARLAAGAGQAGAHTGGDTAEDAGGDDGEPG